MTLLVLATILIVVPLMLFQSVYVFLYSRSFRQEATASRSSTRDSGPMESEQPVAIILCLRGGDPSLERCLASLQNQSHSHFTIHCVFDHRSDPAFAIAQRCLGKEGKFYFFEPDETAGSLKCQALTHTLQHIDADTKFVALVDADAVVSPDWLRTLLQPFHDPNVVASTGNRWFQSVPGLGSQLRRVWNAAAVVQMQRYNIPWGGSLAVRTDLARDEALVALWKHSFCEDTSLKAYLQKNSAGKLVRVPELIISNDESTQLNSAFHWITRQLLTTRLYEKRWPLVFLHAISVGTALLGSLTALIWSVVYGTLGETLWLTCLFMAYQIVNGLLIRWIASINEQFLVRESKAANPEPSFESNTSSTTSSILVELGATLIAQVVQPAAAIRAHFLKVVQWRGIQYQLLRGSKPRWPKIKMQAYRPYTTSRESNSID